MTLIIIGFIWCLAHEVSISRFGMATYFTFHWGWYLKTATCKSYYIYPISLGNDKKLHQRFESPVKDDCTEKFESTVKDEWLGNELSFWSVGPNFNASIFPLLHWSLTGFCSSFLLFWVSCMINKNAVILSVQCFLEKKMYIHFQTLIFFFLSYNLESAF